MDTNLGQCTSIINAAMRNGAEYSKGGIKMKVTQQTAKVRWVEEGISTQIYCIGNRFLFDDSCFFKNCHLASF